MDETVIFGQKNLNWKDLSSKLRASVIELSHKAQTPHLGSSLSCIDILAVLYKSILRVDSDYPDWPDRDRFILSKGHAASALYAVLAYKNFISGSELEQYGKAGSLLEEHPSPKQSGVEVATGSLGHGLPVGNGIALAAQIKKKSYRTIVLMSDGECNEGSVWEAAMFAPRHQLSSLCAIIDYNKWQATGRSRDVLRLECLADKWRSFGWFVEEVDGHDHDALYDALSECSSGVPKVVIAHTVKGKGVSFMEDDNNWHYRIPTEEEVIAAHKELGVS